MTQEDNITDRINSRGVVEALGVLVDEHLSVSDISPGADSQTLYTASQLTALALGRHGQRQTQTKSAAFRGQNGAINANC